MVSLSGNVVNGALLIGNKELPGRKRYLKLRKGQKSMSVKVLFFNSRGIIDQKAGGDITQMLCTAEELTRLGVRVDFWNGDIEQVAKYDLIHIFNIQTANGAQHMIEACRKLKKPIVLSTIWWDLGHFWECRDLFQFSTTKIIRALSRLDWRLGRGYSFIRGVWGRKKTRKSQECLLKAAKVILPNSIAELEILVQQFRMPQLRAKASIVPNGVIISEEDGSKLHDYWPELPDRYVLQVGTCHPVKGQAKVIRALVSDRDVPIVFVGANWDETRYGRWCLKIGKERGNTFFIGKVRHDLMPVLYSHAVVHVLPSLRESPGLASLEAAVYGANCVVSIHCPVAEYFGNDVFVCDPDDLQTIRDAVLRAWTNLPTSALRSRIVSLFTWMRAAECTYQAYEKCRELMWKARS